MNIYEIQQSIMALVDPETGEIADFETLDNLIMARDEKIENIALWIKNLVAESKAIREEEKTLAERRRSAESKTESLKKYLDMVLAGDKFTTPRVAITYRKSSAVEVDEGFVEWANESEHRQKLLRFSDPSIDKTAIKDLLAGGTQLKFARIVENQNLQIK